MGKISEDSQDLVVKPTKPFWKSVKVSDDKSIIIKTVDSEITDGGENK